MILRHAALLWLVPLAWAATWALRRSVPRPALVLRAALLALLVGALAEPVLPGTPLPAPLLVLVDQSASLPAADRTAAWNAAQQLVRERGAARTVVAAVGREVKVAAGLTPPAVDPRGTDLAAALRLAQGFGGHTVLLSDGAATTPDTDALAQQLRGAGIVVDVVRLAPTAPPDARVAAITLPAGLRAGQTFAGEVIVEANTAVSALLRLSQDGAEISSQPVQLKNGRVAVPFQGSLAATGLHSFQATIDLPDAHAENNQLDQTVLVGPEPKVLVIERTPDSAAALRDTLERGGIQSEARRPADLPGRLTDLARFDAVVLNDVAAGDLSLDQQATLRESVRATGHGLIALGGQNSFGLGGYQDTPLAAALPVDMQPPPRRERQEVALLLIVDRSASMYGIDPRSSKLELAKAAALAAVQSLVPDDRIAIEVFDTAAEYAVPFSRIGTNQSVIEQQIRQIGYNGGTNIYGALAFGLPDLIDQPTLVKHAVLLTDGRSYSRESYDQLVGTARDAGVTLSTIAIGNDADTELLQRLADLGGGRYHFAADPQDLPRLTLEETNIARSDPKVEGLVRPQVETPHPTVRGLHPADFPTLTGYVATTPKPSADIILQTADGDALLAGWQFGLGRSLAWLSDSGPTWAGGWQQWPEAPLFWSQLLAYTFPDPSSGPLTLRVTSAISPALVAEATTLAGAPLDLADVGARIVGPDGQSYTLRLEQVAPGRYTAPLTVTDVGSYQIGVAARKGETELSAALGYVAPYAAEFGRAPDPALLSRIAQTTGGEVWPNVGAAVQALRTSPPRPERALWPWLVGAALLAWLAEIAVRRRWRWR